MKRHLDEELNALKERILRMGSLCEEMIRFSVKTFSERKEEFSQHVFEREQEVNRMQIAIDEDCIKILALYQPEAIDLRSIIASVKINSELERVADQAVNMTQTSCYYLLKETPLQNLLEIPRMAALAQEMIKDCLDAFSKKDPALAQSVLMKDQEEDQLKSKAVNEIITLIPSHPDQVRQFIDLILIAKNLEKIGDHATNIAEDVIFMVSGKDIRHPIQQI